MRVSPGVFSVTAREPAATEFADGLELIANWFDKRLAGRRRRGERSALALTKICFTANPAIRYARRQRQGTGGNIS
jgi:hypothetical protein